METFGGFMKPRLLLSTFFGAVFLTALLFLGLKGLSPKLPPLGALLDPVDGVYRLARKSSYAKEAQLSLSGLKAAVSVERNERGVPMIKAQHEEDAVMTLGYITAQDRLFQLDFIPRVAQGRLAEILGSELVPRDRFLRSTGMNWGAQNNLAWLKQHTPKTIQIMEQYCKGVNAYLDQLKTADLPLEFRLLNYRPERCSPIRVLLMLQYMNFDLSWGSDNLKYEYLRRKMGEEQFNALYPQFATYYSPISPEPQGYVTDQRPVKHSTVSLSDPTLEHLIQAQTDLSAWLPDFLQPEIGSNNWSVSGEKTTSGKPMLAGDPHLSLTLPSIWYEVHIQSPTLKTNGVLVPGSPLPVIGFNEFCAWTPTNTDIDQIDYYRLHLNARQDAYQYMGEWRKLVMQPDTIRVKGGDVVLDTLRYSHWGPVLYNRDYPEDHLAVQWTAHKPSRTMEALWGFNHAASFEDFQNALRLFDTPMQNWNYADRDGNIAVRSTGHMPIRNVAYAGGVFDGSQNAGEWIGRVPFEQLPSSHNPARHYLFTANQQPANEHYAYFQRVTWADGFRSVRIDSLLASSKPFSQQDMERFQADVKALQLDLLRPMMQTALSGEAEQVRQQLLAWDGWMGTDDRRPIMLDVFLNCLRSVTWDEFSDYDREFRNHSQNAETKKPSPELLPRPEWKQWLTLITEHPDAPWVDFQKTAGKETPQDLIRMAFTMTADSLKTRYTNPQTTWGDVHRVRMNHLLATLKPLGRGPFAYPGYANTVSPARGRTVVHSASWRMVADFSQGKPIVHGVYPGGPSGNPFSAFYDVQIPTFLAFGYYDVTPAKHRSVYVTRFMP